MNPNKKNFIFYSFLLILKLQAYQHELSVCAIFRNEDRFLKDWIDFHLAMGVEHFYLYNHKSNDNYKVVLTPYIEQGLVELFDWDFPYKNLKNWNRIQCNAYNNALNRSKNISKWVAFIDTDEYLYSPEGTSLKEILKDYEGYGAVCANWVFYGTSSIHLLNPAIPLIFQLTHRFPLEHNELNKVKSIVDPIKVLKFQNPHFPLLRPRFGTHQVTENNEKFIGPFSPSLSIRRIRINHYWTRDEKFFYETKITRLSKWQTPNNEEFEPEGTIIDTEICDIYLQLK